MSIQLQIAFSELRITGCDPINYKQIISLFLIQQIKKSQCQLIIEHSVYYITIHLIISGSYQSIPLMTNNSIMYCINNHQALSMCFEKNCEHHSFICENNDCEANINHKSCTITHPVKDVSSRLSQKQIQFEKMDGFIMNLYKSALTQITKDFEDYSKNQRQTFKLKNEQKEMLEAFRSGKAYQMSPEVISKGTKKLMMNPKTTYQKQTSKLIRNLEEIKFQHDILYNLAKWMWLGDYDFQTYPILGLQDQDQIQQPKAEKNKNKISQSSNDLKFYDQPQLKGKFMVSESGKSIKKVKDNKDSHFAVVSTPILNQISQVRVKISNIGGFGIAIGMGHIKTLSKNKFRFVSNMQGGFYGVWNFGEMIYHQQGYLNGDYCDFRCVNGDIIIIQIDTKVRAIHICTQNQKQKYAKLTFTADKQNPLHVCILMPSKGDQVQVL